MITMGAHHDECGGHKEYTGGMFITPGFPCKLSGFINNLLHTPHAISPVY